MSADEKALTVKQDHSALAPAPETETVLTISAEKPGLVLPSAFYQGASRLVLSEDENKKLAEFDIVPDEQIQIRPDSFLYASHYFYRRALNSVVGAGQWALLPASPVQFNKEKGHVYREWVLMIRGHFVGQTMGWSSYYEDSNRANYSDAAETTASDAIARICAKTLGIGTGNINNKRFADKWRKENAIKVNVKVRKWRNGSWEEKRETWWRLTDSDQFEGELEPVNGQITREAQPQGTKPQPEKQPDAKITKEQSQKIFILVADLNLETDEIGKCLKQIGHAGKLADLPADKFLALVQALEKRSK